MNEAGHPKVTVVTAAFNALEGLRETVASVAAQDYGAIEHVIVDGGSTDGTADYLTTLPHTVRWISEPDGGIGDAMNKGIAMATGEYVLVLHAQDRFVAPDSLARLARQLAGGADIVSADILMEESGKLRLLRSKGGGWRGLFHMPLPHQGVLCRRELFTQIGGFDGSYRIAMDYDFFLRARAASASIATVGYPLSIMPATGISSRRDWPGMSARLDEFKGLHFKHADGLVMRGIYHLYWAAYRPFKWVKHGLLGGASHG